MTRVSKKDRLKKCPRKPRKAQEKTGPKKDHLPKGYRVHTNALEGSASSSPGIFIPKIS